MNRDTWVKSSASAYDGNCVEVAVTFTSVAIRNSRDHTQVLYGLSHEAFRALIGAIKGDEF